MEEIEFIQLSEVQEEKIIDLMNNKLVRKQLPLLTDEFSSESCRAFLTEKQRLWDEHGFGPWAFLIEGEFAGWGGLQPEHGEADFALILHPQYWGWGLKIFNKVMDWAFTHKHFDAITILFPPSRTNSRAITRYGFVEDGIMVINGETFRRFRLRKSPT